MASKTSKPSSAPASVKSASKTAKKTASDKTASKKTASKKTASKKTASKKTASKKTAGKGASDAPVSVKTAKPPREARAPKRVRRPAAPAPAELQQLIAVAAYLRAEQRGFGPGNELEDWLAAEAEVTARFA